MTPLKPLCLKVVLGEFYDHSSECMKPRKPEDNASLIHHKVKDVNAGWQVSRLETLLKFPEDFGLHE